MVKDIKSEDAVMEPELPMAFESKKMEHVSEDMQREDLNALARKVNEIIDHLNA